ncbi:MAG: butyrate kinase [Clostridiales bacterium]|jgi:butyrate kinase|nr:butyrate kinase [Clostridiales bacterium]
MSERLLIINPGSTSTKIAVFEGESPLFTEIIEHDQAELDLFRTIYDQYEYRKRIILESMETHGVEPAALAAVVSRGGLLPPVQSGAYIVNRDMLWQLRHNPENDHASNLGALIAKSIADELSISAYVYDPVTVDEMLPIAKICGLPEFRRKSMIHALNMRASAIRYAAEKGVPYPELTLIVAHLGGGITLSLHCGGKMIDVASDEEGPFSPERAGGLPTFQTLKLAAESGKDFSQLYNYVKKKGGLAGHLGLNDGRQAEKRILQGDAKAELIYKAMAYNISKFIGGLATAACGKVDAVILTGGLAHSDMLCGWIRERVEFIAPVSVHPGENEMQSLANGVLRVLRGEEGAHSFTKVEGKF